MKRGALILLLAVASAVAGYCIYYQYATASTRSMVAQSGGEMQWLRREFGLTDDQFSRIRQLHHDYAPKCEIVCQQIAKANAALGQTIRSHQAVTPEVEAAMREVAAVQQECHRTMLAHIYAVSAVMSPEARARYLEMMQRRLIEPPLAERTPISPPSR